MKYLATIFAVMVLNIHIMFGQWSNQISGTNEQLLTVQFLNSNLGYTCSGGGSVLKTTNGGSTWVNFPTAFGFGYFEFLDSDTALGSLSGAELLKSTDGGLTWPETLLTVPSFIVQCEFPTYSVGYVAALNVSMDSVSIYKTTNGGTNWSIILTQVGTGMKLYFKDANLGFRTDPTGQIFRTTNGGSSWNFVFNPSAGVYDMYFPSSSIGYACSDNSYLKTTDSGVTWNETPLPYVGGYFGIDCTDTNTCYIVGGDGFSTGTLLQTTNGGTNWNQTIISCDQLWDVDFVNDTIGYTCGIDGTIMKYGNTGMGFQSLSFPSFKIFPNPTTDFFQVEFDNNDYKDMTAVLYDKYGKSVLVIQNLQTNTKVDLGGIALGEYVIQFFNKEQRFASYKIIVVH